MRKQTYVKFYVGFPSFFLSGAACKKSGHCL